MSDRKAISFNHFSKVVNVSLPITHLSRSFISDLLRCLSFFFNNLHNSRHDREKNNA
jgi:hypothetical protein